MALYIQFEVIEHFGGEDAPEPFGYENFPAHKVPECGDIVMLHWLDRSEAYAVKVIDRNGATLHVEKP